MSRFRSFGHYIRIRDEESGYKGVGIDTLGEANILFMFASILSGCGWEMRVLVESLVLIFFPRGKRLFAQESIQAVLKVVQMAET